MLLELLNTYRQEGVEGFWHHLQQFIAVFFCLGWLFYLGEWLQERPATEQFGEDQALVSRLGLSRDQFPQLDDGAGSGVLIFENIPFLQTHQVKKQADEGDVEHDAAVIHLKGAGLTQLSQLLGLLFGFPEAF